MVGEIISECWATSNRNGGRDHSGMVGDIERNQHPFIVAGGQLEVLGSESQHRGLKLNERLGRIDPDRGGGGDAALLLAGHAAGV
jgi:hypothetical protein